MKKFFEKTISIIALISCVTVLLINIILKTNLGNYEIIKTDYCGYSEIALAIVTVCVVLLLSKVLNKIFLNKSKLKKVLLFSFVAILYLIVQIVWINTRYATPAYDQEFVLSIAEKMYDNKYDEIGDWYTNYLERCPQQISLSWFWSKMYKVFGVGNILNFEFANAVLNTLTFIGLIVISKQFGQKYEINTFKTIVVSLLFISLAMFSTFVYGDIPSITFCVYAVYFIMKYVQTKKIGYALGTAILTSLAIIVRTNSYIFLIAIAIYLLLDLLSSEKREILKKSLIFISVIIFSILPSMIIKTNIQNKLNIDRENSIPTLAYLYMGMQESSKANGWYNFDIMGMTFDLPEEANATYKKLISERLDYFAKNPIKFLEFYTFKIASMWAENTYAANLYNNSAYCGVSADRFKLKKNKEETEKLDKMVDNAYKPISIIQKGIIIFTFGMVIRILIKYRKNISKEVLLLLLIFMGGFFFHILWEAKSRYILLYIVMLFPLVSINVPAVKFLKWKGMKKIEEFKEKVD